MVRKVSAISVRDSDSSSSSSGSSSEGESTRSVFAARDDPVDNEPEVSKPGDERGGGGGELPVDPESLLPGREGYEAGYNSEEFFRYSMDHSRFAVNHIGVNRMTAIRISQIATEFSIPDSVGMRMPAVGELASNPMGVAVAFHPAFLEIGARLPLHPYIRRVLRECSVAPAQLNPNAWRVVIGMFALWRRLGFPEPTLREIRHCYSFRPHRAGGDGWWALASFDKQGGEPLITGLPTSNKEWKKSWFVAAGDWGKDLHFGGRRQSVRSVFNLPGVWDSLLFLLVYFVVQFYLDFIV